MLLTYNVMCKKIKHFLHSFTFSSRLISVNFLNVLANFPLHFLRRDAMTPIMQYIYLQGRAHENFLNQIFWVQSLSWQRLLRGVSSYFHSSFWQVILGQVRRLLRRFRQLAPQGLEIGEKLLSKCDKTSLKRLCHERNYTPKTCKFNNCQFVLATLLSTYIHNCPCIQGGWGGTLVCKLRRYSKFHIRSLKNFENFYCYVIGQNQG